MIHLISINHLNEKFYNLKIFFCFPHNNDIWFCEFLYCNLFLLFSLLFNKRCNHQLLNDYFDSINSF